MNHSVTIYLFLFLIIFYSNILNAVEKNNITIETFSKIQPEQGSSGYIGFELLLSVQLYQDLEVSIAPIDTPFLIFLPFRLEGASKNYTIITSIDIFSDLIQISKYYDQNTDFLEKRPSLIYSYSYLNFDISYLIIPSQASYKLLLGIDLGHYGFLSLNFDPISYVLAISPIIDFKYIILDSLLYSLKLEIPIAVYKKNIKSYFQFKFDTWFSFEPFGHIINPPTFGFLYHLGFKFEYNRLRSSKDTEKVYQNLNWFPYVKVSFIY